jgi:ABC-2 type transport system ATP-binding protein
MERRKVVIATEGLTKEYGGQVAVDHISFEVEEGEIFGFLGPNGAGKTTTLLMLLGLSEPTEGRALVLGVDPLREPIKVKRMVGYLQENMGFYREMDARQMLKFIGELNGIVGAEAEGRIEESLKEVGLIQEAGKKIDAYSRGMRQRLGIAEILLKEPRVAFLDEPTIGLDPEGTNRMIALIKRLASERGMTIMLSSHLLYQAQKVCDRFGIMISGRLVGMGTMEELGGEKIGIGRREYTLEEVYMKFFKEE